MKNYYVSLGMTLKNAGYNVSLAESGDRAIELLENNEYDLIITDLMMEGANGVEVLKSAKDKNKESMVIIITGYEALDTAIYAVQLDTTDYMLKPYNKNEMLFRVARCFERLETNRKIKLYEDILPVCCKCQKERDDTGVEPGHGKWIDMNTYLIKRANVGMSPGYCT